ncbi:unnamed protein product [Diamesa serratosioi]
MLVLQNIYKLYDYCFNTFDDPRVKDLPLIDKPWLVLGIVVAYLYFVKHKGIALMKDRPPFKLRKTILVYNTIQVIANFVCATITLKHTYIQGGYSFSCQPVPRGDFSPSGMIIRNLCYTYFIAKIIDLFDTVFFILRKKNSQITFLHVYHHAIMVVCTYAFVKFYSAGGHPILLGIINSYVHSVVYGYYLLTAFKPELKSSMWWKKYVTLLQLVQFAILIVHFSVPLFLKECCYSRPILAFLLLQNVCMFVLFSDFYIKTYIKTNKKNNK